MKLPNYAQLCLIRAFAKLHPDFIIHLKKNHTALVRLMSAHVLPGTLYSAGLKDGMQVKTLLGNKLEVKIDSNGEPIYL